MKILTIAIGICFTTVESNAQFQSQEVHTTHVVQKHVYKHRHAYRNRIVYKCVIPSPKVSLDSVLTNDPVLNNFVKNWVGTKYCWGGNTKNGIDCSGFSKALYDSVYHIELPRTAKDQYYFVKNTKKDSLMSGRLLFFKTNKGHGWHVGVYLRNGYFIHSANKKSGVIITLLNKKYYLKRLLES